MKSLTTNDLRITTIVFLLVLISFFNAFSQEQLTPLRINPVLKACITNAHQPWKNASHLKSGKTIYATLPFVDDFSGTGAYPDPTHWTDFKVFINNEYPVNPPTVGVATFDALDENGNLYKNASSTAFSADTLTSVPIRLDTSFFTTQKHKRILPSDSIYLSFFYQPGGLGNAPDPQDSLVLEFYSVNENKWHWVWSTPGMPLDTFTHYNPKVDSIVYKTSFRKVWIPIKDTTYLQKGFRFRFRNYETVANTYLSSWASGNVNIWNLDYVLIDTNRRMNDTVTSDVAFKTNPGNLLSHYTSMPWLQYRANPSRETSSKIAFNIHNFNKISRDITQYFRITDLLTNTVIYDTIPSGAGINIRRLSDSLFSPALYNFKFHSVSKPEDHQFKVSAYLHGENVDFYHKNDSVSFIQRFNSYYSYDDGNPEAGYGLNGAPGLIAYRFTLDHVPDTLTSVAIFFNSTLQNANHESFSIIVWTPDGTKDTLPGKILFTKLGNLPGDSGLDVFSRYNLDTNLIIRTQTFFVGVNQLTKDNINIGFDLNNDSSSKLYYTVGGQWTPSIYPGSLMLRPSFGSYPTQSVREITSNSTQLILYPNPVTGNSLNLKLIGTSNDLRLTTYDLRLYSSIGKEIPILNSHFSPGLSGLNSQLSIALPDLSDGIYILHLSSQSNNISISKKFMVRRN